MLPFLRCFSSSPGAPWGEQCDMVLWVAASTGQVRTWVFQSMMDALRFRGVGDTKNIREQLWTLSELCSPNLLAHSASLSILSSGPAVPWEHRKHHGEVAVGLQPSRWCVSLDSSWAFPKKPSASTASFLHTCHKLCGMEQSALSLSACLGISEAGSDSTLVNKSHCPKAC